LLEKNEKRAARVLIGLLKRKKITLKFGDAIRYNFTNIDIIREGENPKWQSLVKSSADCCKRVSPLKFREVARVVGASQGVSPYRAWTKMGGAGYSLVYRFRKSRIR